MKYDLLIREINWKVISLTIFVNYLILYLSTSQVVSCKRQHVIIYEMEFVPNNYINA